MAEFRTHFAVGLGVGYLAGVTSVIVQWASAPLTPLLVFIGTTAGSLLPDLDSDNSVPFSVSFGILSFLGGSLAFAYCTQRPQILAAHGWIAIPPFVALFIRYGIGNLFKAFTVHRGIFHSLPMVLIVTGASALLLRPLELGPTDVIVIALGVGLGFLAHLVLDEIYAAIDFNGLKLEPKKSFGTAVTLASPSLLATACAYITLGGLVFLNWALILEGIAFVRNN